MIVFEFGRKNDVPGARGIPDIDIDIGRNRLFSLNVSCEPPLFANRERDVADDTAGVT